jgi:hypothetical protein
VNTPVGNQPTSQSNSQSPTQPASAPQASATSQLGTARSNPAPVGSEIHSDSMAFTVTGMVRPADK